MPATVLPMPIERDYAEETVQGDRSDILHSIRNPFTALALWHRRLPASIEEWLNSLSLDQLPRGRLLARRAEFGLALEEFLSASATPRGRGASHFIADAVNISTLFADIAGLEMVDIGLKAIQHDACWMFHRDYVSLRALTTYLGPGTQLVAASEADRALKDQTIFRGRVREVPRHSVAIFKGATDAAGRGVVHRSPPIAGTGQTRLVLTLNIPGEVSPKHRVLGRAWSKGAAA